MAINDDNVWVLWIIVTWFCIGFGCSLLLVWNDCSAAVLLSAEERYLLCASFTVSWNADSAGRFEPYEPAHRDFSDWVLRGIPYFELDFLQMWLL